MRDTRIPATQPVPPEQWIGQAVIREGTWWMLDTREEGYAWVASWLK